MGALARPDLSPGAHRELVAALHDLHHDAGWPSLRRLAAEAGCSHTTVSNAFSSSTLPSWGTLELLVEALDGDTDHFHDLWLAATTPVGPPKLGAPRMAGRPAELDVVRRHLETGHGLLLVVGEAGIGKTKLVTTAAPKADAFVTTGHCLPLATEVPLLPIADMLRAVYDFDGGEWFRTALATCPAYAAGSLSPLLPEVVSDSAATGTRRDDPRLLFASVGRILGALCAVRMTSVVIEDLHWADPATLDVLEHLLASGSPVPLVGTWRSEDDSASESARDWLRRVRRGPGVTTLGLEPLTQHETAEQVRQLGFGRSSDVDRIYALSRGHPLFTEQLATHAGDTDDMPVLLAELLNQRLEGVSGAAWAVLRSLGLAERPLSPAVLASTAGLADPELTSELRTLQARRLLRTDADDRVELRHPLLAEAVRRRVVAGEGAATHRCLAAALGDHSGATAAEIAEHWRRGDRPEQEIRWRIAAARSAGSLFDRAQEAEHWLRTLDIWPDLEVSQGDPAVTRSTAYLAAVDALRASLQVERAEVMNLAGAMALGEIDEQTRAELLLRAAELRGRREGAAVAIELVDEALVLFDRRPASKGKLRAIILKVAMLESLGCFAEAGDLSAVAVATAGEVGEPALLRDCLMQDAWRVAVAGDLEAGMAALTEASEAARVGSDPYGDLRQAEYATDMMLTCGADPDRVVAVGEAGLALARELRIEHFVVVNLRGNVATALLRAGRVSDAERATEVGREDPLDLSRMWSHILRAAVDATRGDLAAAQLVVDRVWTEGRGQVADDLEFLTIAATIAGWDGTPAIALERVLPALDAHAGSSPVRKVAPALVAAMRCAADAAATDAVAPLDAELIPSLRQHADRAGLFDGQHRLDSNLAAHAAQFSAELARTAGEDRIEDWVQAASLWDRLRRPHDKAYCTWRAAGSARRDGRGELAGRLLKRASADAGEHVPLGEAIAASHIGR